MSGPGKEPRNHAVTAALLGGAVGAAAGAAAAGVWSARAIARRNGAGDGKEINAVLKTAATACELSHGPAAEAVGNGRKSG
jgi:hypothetical protein